MMAFMMMVMMVMMMVKTITAWTVALSCYISHGAMHRKKADFDPSGGQNPWTNFDETWHG